MRISEKEKRIICDSIGKADPDAQVLLFGSRVDDAKKGGDIDLLVLSDELGFSDLWPIRREILDVIGWQKLDIVIEPRSGPVSSFGKLALETGQRL